MITISVPTERAVPLLADVPVDVEVLVWDGRGDPPHGVERIELFVGRYGSVPPERDAFARMPALRAVQLVSAGIEPWPAALPDGVVLCNGRGVHGASTAELALAGMLGVLRELPRFIQAQTQRKWDRHGTDGLAGRRVLVLGAGDIGRRIAKIVQILDAEATLVARTGRDGVRTIDDVPALLPDHDIVVVALPLTVETEGIVDADFLAAMPDDALLVNIARGGHVDTDALLAELNRGRLRAFLDVTEPEPLPADHPLWAAPNLLLTPHVGGGTRGWEARAYRLVVEQTVRLMAGEELTNQVSAGY